MVFDVSQVNFLAIDEWFDIVKQILIELTLVYGLEKNADESFDVSVWWKPCAFHADNIQPDQIGILLMVIRLSEDVDGSWRIAELVEAETTYLE